MIKNYINNAGYAGAVCFSCGNAARALIDEGVNVLEVGPKGMVCANKWWKPEEIHYWWPRLFDATPGHLPLHLMEKVSRYILSWYGYRLDEAIYAVATGSGESLLCLQMAYPKTKFIAVYGYEKGAEYDEKAPLNSIIANFFEVIHYGAK